MKYRKKPIIIKAEQFDGTYVSAYFFVKWIAMYSSEVVESVYMRYVDNDEYEVRIKTLEGEMIAQNGDWIIRDVNNEFYPLKPDIFEATYELVEEESE